LEYSNQVKHLVDFYGIQENNYQMLSPLLSGPTQTLRKKPAGGYFSAGTLFFLHTVDKGADVAYLLLA